MGECESNSSSCGNGNIINNNSTSSRCSGNSVQMLGYKSSQGSTVETASTQSNPIRSCRSTDGSITGKELHRSKSCCEISRISSSQSYVSSVPPSHLPLNPHIHQPPDPENTCIRSTEFYHSKSDSAEDVIQLTDVNYLMDRRHHHRQYLYSDDSVISYPGKHCHSMRRDPFFAQSHSIVKNNFSHRLSSEDQGSAISPPTRSLNPLMLSSLERGEVGREELLFGVPSNNDASHEQETEILDQGSTHNNNSSSSSRRSRVAFLRSYFETGTLSGPDIDESSGQHVSQSSCRNSTRESGIRHVLQQQQPRPHPKLAFKNQDHELNVQQRQQKHQQQPLSDFEVHETSDGSSVKRCTSPTSCSRYQDHCVNMSEDEDNKSTIASLRPMIHARFRNSPPPASMKINVSSDPQNPMAIEVHGLSSTLRQRFSELLKATSNIEADIKENFMEEISDLRKQEKEISFIPLLIICCAKTLLATAEKLAVFDLLPKHDKEMLLKGSLTEILFLQSLKYYNHRDQCWNFGSSNSEVSVLYTFFMCLNLEKILNNESHLDLHRTSYPL